MIDFMCTIPLVKAAAAAWNKLSETEPHNLILEPNAIFPFVILFPASCLTSWQLSMGQTD